MKGLATCGEHCGHTAMQHYAFDEGYHVALLGDPRECDYRIERFRMAWIAGHVLGSYKRRLALEKGTAQP